MIIFRRTLTLFATMALLAQYFVQRDNVFNFCNGFWYFFVSTLDPDRCTIDNAARASLCSHMEPTSNMTGSIHFMPKKAKNHLYSWVRTQPVWSELLLRLNRHKKLFSSLMTDHRHAVEVELESHDESYFAAIRREDPRVLTCDFCDQVHLKAPWWNHSSATIFRLARQCMGLMTSQLSTFRTWLIFWAFVVPKLLLDTLFF